MDFEEADERFDSVLALYERGQTLDALRAAEAIAPLGRWHGVKQCVLASRIAANSGAPGLATRLSVRAWKADRNDPDAQSQFGYEIYSYRGPFVFWERSRRWQTDKTDGKTGRLGDFFALRARALADLRDFSEAEKLLAEAEKISPNSSWVRLQRVHWLEMQDRIEEALEMAQNACGRHPHRFYRPGIQMVAHLLQQLDRDDDAIALLEEANRGLQNAPVAAQLYGLCIENGRWAEAWSALDRFETMAPLMDEPHRKWLSSQRARVAYLRGHRVEAARYAGSLNDEFHQCFVRNLERARPEVERVRLDVSFVRQHFKTCAPATLAALGRYWNMPAEHLKVAEAVCYDGTPAWQQREWAEANDWVVREFRVTEQTALALLERAIPFAITTVAATSAHMMAVIGFDRTRGTLMLRDPGQPYVIETPQKSFFENSRDFGPRGVVFIPTGEVERLAGIELPDAALYDHHHRFSLSLARHQRELAEEEMALMDRLDSENALTWDTRCELACYDSNSAAESRCLDKLLELYPNSVARRLRRFHRLEDASRAERLKFLASANEDVESDAAWLVARARTMTGDSRLAEEAHRWLRRALRSQPVDSDAISALGSLIWEEGDTDRATECLRFAANLESFTESLYQSWFLACRRTRRTSVALAHLEDRFARFGSQSIQPALTLAWAWSELEEPERAREVMEEGMRLRPDDGYLPLRAATFLAGLGRNADADRYLEAASGHVRENDWLRARSEIAEIRLDFETAQELSGQLLAREPLALDVHSRIARGLARLQGNAAAVDHLRKACEQFPHHWGLRRMLIEWTRDTDEKLREEMIRKLLEAEPDDAWARRELALCLLQQKRGEEALEEATTAAQIDSGNSFSHSILGHICFRLERSPEAREHCERALTLSVDNSDAIGTLLDLAGTDRERHAALEFVERQLVTQVVAGDGLLMFLEMARPLMQPGDLLAIFRDAHSARPDLWHAWAALISQLGHMGELDEALSLAQRAVQRFAHIPRSWTDLAQVHRWRGEPAKEIEAATRAFEMNPDWLRAVMCLTEALERSGRMEEARQIYERALIHAPREPVLLATRGSLLWRLRKVDEALESVESALRFSPNYEWAWGLLFDWTTQTGQPQRIVEFARALTRERPGEAKVWMVLARVLRGPENVPEQLQAARRAVDLDPRSSDTWDLKAELLALNELFDEATRTCAEGLKAVRAEQHSLRARRAWISARRRRWEDAIREMREVLAENASFVWGWQQLVMWLLEKDSTREAIEALEQLRRLSPRDAWAHRQLGLLWKGEFKQSQAKEAFAAALAADPWDQVSAMSLLEIQLGSDLEAAEETVRQMKIHQPGAGTVVAEIQLRLRQGENAAAAMLLEELCVSPNPETWPLQVAADTFFERGQSRRAMKLFRRMIRSAGVHLELGAAAMRLHLRRCPGRWGRVRAVWLFLRLPPGEMCSRSAVPLVQVLGEEQSGILLRWLVWRRREVLSKDDAAWGQVGFALVSCNRLRATARWLGDWRQRAGVEPWMLFNLCIALRHFGRSQEADEVARHVVGTWEHREGAADMYLFVGLEEALRSDVEAAEKHLRLANVRDGNQHDQALQTLALNLVEFLKTPREERRSKFSQVRKRLDPFFSRGWMPLRSCDVRRSFKRAGEVFVREGAGPGAWLWFRWKLSYQWLILIGLILLVTYLVWISAV